VALILFGTRAYVQVPFTQDLQTAQQLLDQRPGRHGRATDGDLGTPSGSRLKTLEEAAQSRNC
jgi:Ca-activated chloride channel family protein